MGIAKYEITVHSSNQELLDKIYHQVMCTFFTDNRSDVIEAFGIDFDSDSKTFKFTIDEESKFVPTVMYVYDKDITNCGEDVTTTVIIKGGNDITNKEMYSIIGEPIHYNFCGLKEYIDNDIIINVDMNKEVFVGFANCNYYPIIEAVHRG